MGYNLKLDSFEGPLDLLIHLIEKNQLDISEISLQKITSQYLEYLNKMEELDLEIASEFLILAAQLLQLKTRNLLPGGKKKAASPGFHPDLIKRLSFFRQIKKVAGLLDEIQARRIEVYSRDSDHLIYFLSRHEDLEKQRENPLEGINLQQLTQAYNRVCIDSRAQRKKEKKYETAWYELEGETFTVTEKMVEIIDYCSSYPDGFSFKQVVQDKKTPQEKVVSFLALLELIKSRKVKITRGSQAEKLIIKGGMV